MFFCNLFASNDLDNQVVRGQVLDLGSRSPLVDVEIEILNTSPRIFTRTDEDGKFRLENVPIGRHKILFSKEGYEELVINGLEVSSAKEAVLVLKMEESIVKTVSSESGEKPIKKPTKVSIIRSAKDAPNNEFAITTVRLFSTEEVGRFSGARQDPARIVSSYAGMLNINDRENHLSVRSGSPTMLQWRIDGIPVQSPNHLSSFGSTGGRFNILNPSMMDNSDLFLGSKPAEYGNSAGAVFDVALKKGNEEKFEGMAQISGATGGQFMMEGPLSKKKNGSFSAAFRYGLFNFAGMGLENLANKDASYENFQSSPSFWDYTIKFDLPKNKAGEFSFWTIGGIAKEFMDGKDSAYARKNPYINSGEQLSHKTNIGAVGLRHRIAFGKRQQAYLLTRIGGTFSQIEYNKKLFTTNDSAQWVFNKNDDLFTLVLSSVYTQKISRKLSLRAGIFAESYSVGSIAIKNAASATEFTDSTNTYALLGQGHAQVLFRASKKVLLTLGFNAMYLTLNQRFAPEPKFGLRWFIADRHSIFASFGVYNQMQPWTFYNYEKIDSSSGQIVLPFQNLPFMRSHHYFFGYEFVASEDWRIRADVYNQLSYNILMDSIHEQHASANYGGIEPFNLNDNMSPIGNMVSGGVEISIERFFDKGYYLIANSSFFFNRYYRSSTVAYGSLPLNDIHIGRFGDGFGARLLAGKEFFIGARRMNRFTVDFRASYNGTAYTAQIDLPASQIARQTIYDDTKSNMKMKDYIRFDLKFGLIFNGAKGRTSHWLFFDFLNVSNFKNISGFYYDADRSTIRPIYQRPFSVDLFYQFRF